LAIKTGQRPTAFILRDKYAGYRDYDNPHWDFERAPYVNPAEYTRWDYLLASVVQLLEDYTNPNNGQLRWFDESDKVEWDVKSSYSGYDAALDKDDKNLEPGESRYAVPLYDEDDPPTIYEWLEALENDENHPPGYKNSGHQEWEILDAREEALNRRAEIAEKLRRGEAL
jgi:hypothetical protein